MNTLSSKHNARLALVMAIADAPTGTLGALGGLGPIDFSAVEDYKPLPNGKYPGQTVSWESKPTKSNDSTNIEAKFIVEYEEAGETKQRTILNRWNLKPQSLWRIKRDLVAMGADPEDFEGDNVDLQALLNDLFGVAPTPVWVTLSVRSYRPEGADEDRLSNEVTKVEARA